MRAPFAAAVAIAVGLVILAGYFAPMPEALGLVRATLLGWAVILAAVAGLVGVINLTAAHWRKLTRSKTRDPYSLLVILGFVATVAAGIWFKPGSPEFRQVVLSIQAPVETSLMAMLAVSLAYACLRLLQKRRGAMGMIFFVSVIVFLLLGSGLSAALQNLPGIGELVMVINRLPLAGARGILLGVALGSLMTGIRILMGADRPYSG